MNDQVSFCFRPELSIPLAVQSSRKERWRAGVALKTLQELPFFTMARLHSRDLEPAFRGERIDFYAQEIAQENGLPQGVQMTPRGQFGPDFFNPATGEWWDITTPGQWVGHVAKYGLGGTILIY